MFIESVMTETCQVMKIEIREDQGAIWRMGSDDPLPIWLARHPGNLTVKVRPHRNEQALRAWLYKLVACPNIKTVLRRSNHEKAVVAGRLATHY